MTTAKEEQNQRIQEVLKNCGDKGVNLETLAVFHELLRQGLSFPCDVIGKADLIRYILYDIENSRDDMFGLLGKLKLAENEKKEVMIPLCDLKAVDNRSTDFMILNDYGTWFVEAQA